MARGVNSCTFIGNLGNDVELKYTPSGKAVVNASLAVNEEWGTGDDRQQKVEWVSLVVWDTLAEVMGKYCRKGSKLYVTGRLQTRTWENNDGGKQYKTEIVVRELLFLDHNPSEAAQAQQQTREEDDDLPF